MPLRPRSRTKPSEIDWKQILCTLQAKGFTANKIAETVEIGDPCSILRWKNDGVCPRYDNGVALIQLYEQTTGNPAPKARKG